MSLDKYLGLEAKDLPAETVDKLLGEGYSISPKTGRVRRRFRVKDKQKFFKRRKVKQYATLALWILIILAFVTSLIIVIFQSDVKKSYKSVISPVIISSDYI